MDVVRIDKDTYYPTDLVEKFRSCIWAERFDKSHEMQLTTSYKEYTRKLIPEGTLISLLDSQILMMVESHELNSDGDLVVRAQQVDSFLRYRAWPGNYNIHPEHAPYTTLLDQKPFMMVLLMIWNSIVDNTPIYLKVNPTSTSASGYSADLIPNVQVWADPDTLDPDPANGMYLELPWEFQLSDVHTEIWKILNQFQFGLHVHRPLRTIINAPQYTFTTGGGYVGGLNTADDKIRFVVYRGRNRSLGNGDGMQPLVFSYEAEHLSGPKHLWTLKPNVAYAMSNYGGDSVEWPAGTPPTGWDRRVIASDLKLNSSTNLSTNLEYGGQYAIYQEGPSHIFEAEVTRHLPAVYGTDYGLGDILTVLTDTGERDIMRVSEYIRTFDQEGERAFPTLERAEGLYY